MKNKLVLSILDYSDAMPSAVSGIHDIFTIANYQAEQSIFSVSRLTESVPLAVGEQHIVFIPPCLSKVLPSFSDPEVLFSLQRWHASGAVLVAACAGVFWLANAGLLDGKQVTTHWRLCQRLTENYPAIKQVSTRNMVIDQGSIVTAAGLYAFQDLSLHIIARFSGVALAKKIADFCLFDISGRLQGHYSRFHPSFSHGDDLIIQAQQFCVIHLCEKLSLSALSKHCHLSERTLLRRFKFATGYTPKQYMLQLKIEKAKQILQQESIGVDKIGYEIGYQDTSNFIKAFKKIAGVTPAEFRARKMV
ncbi:MAG: helix-turn-helix domain-containing protein [Gammaproteobacteria bacterium]|nr:helix-turn-helix domain-containing protein [Gammaproteobacteria bacterium]